MLYRKTELHVYERWATKAQDWEKNELIQEIGSMYVKYNEVGQWIKMVLKRPFSLTKHIIFNPITNTYD